jgi:glutathione S-transferase
MWVRRIEQKIAEPMGEGFSAEEGREFFEKDRTLDGVFTKTVLPLEAAAVLKRRAREKMIWFDRLFADDGWVCGPRFTLADIYLYCFLQFGENHDQLIPPEAPALRRFFDRMKSRPTAWVGVPGSLDG